MGENDIDLQIARGTSKVVNLIENIF